MNYVEITELLPAVTEPDSSATFTRLKSIRELVLPYLDEYYTYHGSLTTPPCCESHFFLSKMVKEVEILSRVSFLAEVVTWIDFKQSIPLSHSQVILAQYSLFC